MLSADDPLGLLLADAIDLRPVLEDGLPFEAAARAPRPLASPRGVDELTRDAPAADPNSLPRQRWGVIAPSGAAGDDALAALAPLLALRAEEQGDEVRVYRDAPLGAGYQEALRWKNKVWQHEPEPVRPRYLLLVGDLDALTLELQHVLANAAFVGRVHASQPAGLTAYAEKVVRWARSPSPRSQPDALFFVADDETLATRVGRTHLVEPCLALAATRQGFPAAEVAELPGVHTVADFLHAVDRPDPAVLLSVSHGMAAGRDRWKSPEEQRARQGALVIAAEPGKPIDQLLTAAQALQGAFLPGGLWFMVACFGAGTPTSSTFEAWLAHIDEQQQYQARVQQIRRNLPQPGEPGFLSAMPLAVLANPAGPLAVVGHVDLAWTYGFVDPQHQSRSRADRIFSCLRAMVQGARAGAALDGLMRSYREVNDELLVDFQDEEDARRREQPHEVDLVARARAFMLRNDLRGYMLLGDPAVRLPLASHAP